MNLKSAVVAVLCVLSFGVLYAGEDIIDLRAVQGGGMKVLENYSGKPDSKGVMEYYRLALPDFERGCYYASGWWPAGGNRVFGQIVNDSSLNSVPEGGIFLLLKLKKDSYLAVLPIAGKTAYSWFDSKDGRLILKMGTHGKDAIEGDIPLYAWAKADNPYEACNAAWESALDCEQIKGAAFMRETKEYPQIFKYLGWCSWEYYKAKIDEENMVGAMEAIESSGLPIRYLLVDNGHFDRSSLAPNDKFPNGYKPLTDMRKEDKIKWVGIWYAFLGANHGVLSPGNLGEIGKFMYECNADKLLPLNNEKSARAFYEYMLGFAKRDDVDFLKVDFQTDALPFYAGTSLSNPLGGLPADNTNAIGNPVAAAANLAAVFQSVVDSRMNGLINCNWHNAVSVFNSKNSVAGRCSEDYKVGNLERARGHLYHSYAATIWLGQIAWGDHDMFHSSDKAAGRMMAVSKAFSGGPVYLSDNPEHFAPENVWPLCYKDGLLLRPLAPAAPLADCLFIDPLKESKAYKVVAPLANQTAAIVVYNLTEQAAPVKAIITAEDYQNASGMMQPYPGKWKVPAEGLVVYDWYAGKAEKLGREYTFELKGFGDRLLHLCPVRNGWAVIGRTDKYLSPAAVEVLKNTPDKLTIRMIESGPLAIWSDGATLLAEKVSFEDQGDGLWKADIEPGHRNMLITIRKISVSRN